MSFKRKKQTNQSSRRGVLQSLSLSKEYASNGGGDEGAAAVYLWLNALLHARMGVCVC